MKKKHKDLDVDFIGEQSAMTKEEELAISQFLKKEKQKSKKQSAQTHKRRRIKDKQMA
jgi:hypothetical protein